MSTESFADIIRRLRKEQKLPLRKVAAMTDMDTAILSKLERGQRRATRKQVENLAECFHVDLNSLLVAWLSDGVLYQLQDEDVAEEALQVAEAKVAYFLSRKLGNSNILNRLKAGIKKFPLVQKAWIFGSFARGDYDSQSDIDIALQTDEKFSYFDLAEIQYQLELLVNRKVDVGFIDSFEPNVLKNVTPDLKLIYER